MPHDALSLVGFMDQQTALAYMTNTCIFPDNDPAILTQEWQAAQRLRGSAVANAGRPRVTPLAHPYLTRVSTNPHFGPLFSQVQWEFAAIEVRPLLAFQYHVLADAAQQHCATVSTNPSIDDMLPICLPDTYPAPKFETFIQPTGMYVEASAMDMAVLGQGRIILNPDPNFHFVVAGMVFGPPNPWVLVTEYQGRYYLGNGYHRAYGLGQRGATEIPCILVHAATSEQIGLKGGTTFDEVLLASSDPPTCAHLIDNRGYAVAVRHIRKRLAINWNVWDIREG